MRMASGKATHIPSSDDSGFPAIGHDESFGCDSGFPWRKPPGLRMRSRAPEAGFAHLEVCAT